MRSFNFRLVQAQDYFGFELEILEINTLETNVTHVVFYSWIEHKTGR